jgi:hypothetical protein
MARQSKLIIVDIFHSTVHIQPSNTAKNWCFSWFRPSENYTRKGEAHSIRQIIERAAIDFAPGRSPFSSAAPSCLSVAPHLCRSFRGHGQRFSMPSRVLVIACAAHLLPKVILGVKFADGWRSPASRRDHSPARNCRRLTLRQFEFSSLHARPALASFLPSGNLAIQIFQRLVLSPARS